MLAIYFAAKHWAPSWSGQHIVIHSDNTTAVSILNKGSCKNKVVMGFLRELFWLSAIYNFRITAKHIPGQKNVVADAISRLHESYYLDRFCCLLLPWYNFNACAIFEMPLLLHMLITVLFFCFLGSSGLYLKEDLAKEVSNYRLHTFSANTKKSYQTHIDSYLRFCTFLNIFPSILASSYNICLYAAFLARSLKSATVRQYVRIIGLLHKEFNLQNPLTDNWMVESLFRGIKS